MTQTFLVHPAIFHRGVFFSCRLEPTVLVYLILKSCQNQSYLELLMNIQNTHKYAKSIFDLIFVNKANPPSFHVLTYFFSFFSVISL